MGSGYHLLLPETKKGPVFTGHTLAGKQWLRREPRGHVWGALTLPLTACVLYSCDGLTLALGSNLPLPSGDLGLGCSEGLLQL